MRVKCDLCKCLNLIAEGKKHPSISVWNMLNLKYFAIREKKPKSLLTFCELHRNPLFLSKDLISVDKFICEVMDKMSVYLTQLEVQP